MKHYLLILAIMASSSVSVSYGGFLFKGKDKEKKVNKEVYKEAPKWYPDPKVPKGWKYQVSMGTSKFDAQLAIDKAYLSAKTKITALIESQVTEKMERGTIESGEMDDAELNDSFTRTLKTISSTLVKDLVEIDSEVIRHKGDSFYTAYYLIGYNLKEADKKMLESIKREEKLYEHLKMTEMMQELEKDVEEYEKFKETQKN